MPNICPTCDQQFSDDLALCPVDQSKLQAIRDPLISLRIDDRYEIKSVIGVGGWSTVYLGQDLSLKRPVAIKVLHTSLARNTLDIKRFKQEAVAGCAIAQANIITIFDCGYMSDGQPYIIMEYVAGETLKSLLKAHGSLSIERTLKIMIQCCAALAAAHESQIIHRDIKPENIMIFGNSGEDSIKILDFGIARLLTSGDQLTQTGETMGSPAYMSPEQWSGHDIGFGSDIYSLGCVMFECLTGKSPFHSDTAFASMALQAKSKTPILAESKPDIVFPASLQAIISLALQKDPIKRYQSALLMKRDLDAALTCLAGTAQEAGQKGSNGSRVKVLVGFVFTLVAAFSIFAFNKQLSGTRKTNSDRAQTVVAASPHMASARTGKDDSQGNANNSSHRSLESSTTEKAGGEETTQNTRTSAEVPKRQETLSSKKTNTEPGSLAPTAEKPAVARNTDSMRTETTLHKEVIAQKQKEILSDSKIVSTGRIVNHEAESQRNVRSKTETTAVSALPDPALIAANKRSSDELAAANKQSYIDRDMNDIGTVTEQLAPGAGSLDLANPRVKDDDLKSALEAHPDTRLISLIDASITDAGLSYLREYCPGVSVLWLRNTCISDKGMLELAKLKNLKKLSLAKTQISDSGVALLSHLRLVWLRIDETVISGNGLSSLNGDSLTGLSCVHSKIGDDDLDSIVQHFPKMRNLSLQGTKVTNKGVAKLSELLHLEHLVLINDAVSDEAILSLAKCPRLRSIKVTGTKVTEKVVEELKKQGCTFRIVW